MPTLQQSPPEWLTLADIASLLQISLSTAERLKARGAPAPARRAEPPDAPLPQGGR